MNSSNKKPGRNERCHCGSGKKYKHCHLEADRERESARARATAVTTLAPDGEQAGGSRDIIAQLPKRLEKLSKKGSAKERAEFADLLKMSQPVVACLRREEEIETAAAALDPYRKEFERLLANEKEYLARARALFAEECFAPLRFSADDIRRAFDAVGYPPDEGLRAEAGKLFRAAILWLADKDRRADLSMSLCLRLPEFTAAGRFMEGWLIQHCAYVTTELAGESNVFLFEMFASGYDEWTRQSQTQIESLLERLGLSPDRARGMSMEEIDAWLAKEVTDPALASILEAHFAANPGAQAQADANIRARQIECVQLLERPDSGVLLLSPEEVHDWLPGLLEVWQTAHPGPIEPPEEPGSKAGQDAVFSRTREMAQAVFTKERVGQLVFQLRKYRDALFDAGEKTAASYASAALSYVEREDEPGHNAFLVAVCLRSIGPAAETAAAGEAELPG